MLRGLAAAALALVVTAVTMAAPRTARAQVVTASPFDTCAPPDGRWTSDSLLCVYRTGTRLGRLDEARARLRALGGGDPSRPWATLALGFATQQQDEAAAIRLYERAADGFMRAGLAEGEVLARHNLRNAYWRRGDAEAAGRHVARARALAAASVHPLVIARAGVLEAGHLIESGGDLDRASQALMRAERVAFPSGPIGLRRTILFNLANAHLYLGRVDEAIDALERHRALRKEDGSPNEAAMVAFNLLNARLTRNEMQPRPGARDRLIAEAREVLAQARQLQRPAVEARVHRVLGDLLRTSDPDAAAFHLDRCLALEASLGQPEVRAGCYWSLSLNDAARDPARAEHRSRQALDVLGGNPDGPLRAFAWRARLRLVWLTLPPADATQESLGALTSIERLRASQPDDGTRAALFSNWASDYAWLAGRLLSTSPARIAEAFEVGERLRTRVLLERLTRGGASTGDAATPIRDRLPVASMAAVQDALSSGEAMLWFTVAPWTDVYGEFGGGAWMLAVTRHAVAAHRVAEDVDLHSQVSALTGLLRERAEPAARWERAATTLSAALFGQGAAVLPPDITRLVIVTDGPLHRLPFEVMRVGRAGHAGHAGPHQARLGDRYDVTVVPSATLWLRLRQVPAPRASSHALVLADPALASPTPLEGIRLDPLPWARREARAIGRTLRLGAGASRQGLDASERSLKREGIDAAILHVAAHAHVDETFPDRSAVFLAPGGLEEDGLLQSHEIAALDLRGRVVVLSACDSAEGLLLAGEGPLSLARAFFAAGAAAVVATRWPLRDDDAAFLMERLYRTLATGGTLAAGLRSARRDAVAAGRPAAAWAGLVLLGDGSRTPIAVSRTAHPAGQGIVTGASSHLKAALAGLALLGLVTLLAVRRGRRPAR